MKNMTIVSRRAVAGVFAALALAGTGGIPALAHETSCPYCKLKVTQDTPTQDNETVLRLGRKRLEYKCVYCALADANAKYKDSDVTILAPSEKKAQPVEITRTGGNWDVPKGAVFVGVKASHKVCHITYRAFTNQAAFDTYVAANKAQVTGAQPLTLTQMVALAR